MKLSLRELFLLVAIAALGCVSPDVRAEDRDPPPSLGLARLSRSGDEVEVGQYVVETTFDKTRDVPVTTRRVHYVSYRVDEVAFFDLTDKPIEAAVAQKRLKSETPIIVLHTRSRDKKAPKFDRAYLPLFKSNVMIVTVPPDEGEIELSPIK
jgi:hypothetical protein